MTKIKTSLALLAAPLALGMAAAQDHKGMDHSAMAHQHGDDHVHDHDALDADEADVGAAPTPAGRTVTARVHGMVCDFCARSLTKVLSRRDEVEAVAIDLTDKTVTIVLREDETLSDEEIERAVLDAGYNLAALERS